MNDPGSRSLQATLATLPETSLCDLGPCCSERLSRVSEPAAVAVLLVVPGTPGPEVNWSEDPLIQ